MEESYGGRRKEVQTKGWSECCYDRLGPTNIGCFCDHKRLEGSYARGRNLRESLSFMRGRQTKWGQEKNVLQDVVKKL
jgi:hypothetical protein